MKRKKILAVLLACMVTLGMTACSDGLSSQEIQNMEKYSKAAGQSFEYSSSDHITNLKIAVPSGEKTLAEILEKKTGKLENIDLSSIKAIVTEKNSTGGEMYFVTEDIKAEKYFGSSAASESKSSASTGEEESSTDSGSSAASDASESAASDMTETMANMSPEELQAALDAGEIFTEEVESSSGVFIEAELAGEIADFIGKSASYASSPEGLRTLLAEVMLKAEAYQEQHPSEYEAYQGYKKDLKKSEKLEENQDYYLKIAANQYQSQFDLYDFYMDYLGEMIAACEETDEEKLTEQVQQIDEKSEDDFEVRGLLLEQAGYRNSAVSKAAEAQAVLDANKSTVDAAKKESGDEYKDDERYLKLMAANSALKSYEDDLFKAEQCKISVTDLRERQALNDEELEKLYKSIHEAEAGYREDYYNARYEYAQKLIQKENYQNQHAAEFAEYQTTADSIKSKYEDDSYEKDMDYVKNEVKFQSINSMLESYENDLKVSENAIAELKEELDSTVEKKESSIAEREEEMKAEADWEKVREAAEEIISEMNEGYDNPPEEKTSSHYIGEYGGLEWIDLSDDGVESVDSARDVKTTKSSSSYTPKSSSGSSGGMKYDPNDEYYSSNDHDGDGRLSDDEFHDAVGDYMDDLMGY